MKNSDTIRFGKYKGKRLDEVPDHWFRWMRDRGLLTKEMKDYAEGLKLSHGLNKKDAPGEKIY